MRNTQGAGLILLAFIGVMAVVTFRHSDPTIIVTSVVLVVGLGGVMVLWRSLDEARAGGGTESTEPATSIPSKPILSDEEQVVALLEAGGGRMKQATIVEETEWSKSKVSMLLSDMEEVGTIEKLRLGRENVISLTEEIETEQ